LKEDRPWGSFKVLSDDLCYKIKIIRVKPGKRLSLQRHHHRDEFWYFTKGEGNIVIGCMNHPIELKKYYHIPQGEIHRIENTSNKTLVLIELQIGIKLSEDDIERLEDDYGRC